MTRFFDTFALTGADNPPGQEEGKRTDENPRRSQELSPTRLEWKCIVGSHARRERAPWIAGSIGNLSRAPCRFCDCGHCLL